MSAAVITPEYNDAPPRERRGVGTIPSVSQRKGAASMSQNSDTVTRSVPQQRGLAYDDGITDVLAQMRATTPPVDATNNLPALPACPLWCDDKPNHPWINRGGLLEDAYRLHYSADDQEFPGLHLMATEYPNHRLGAVEIWLGEDTELSENSVLPLSNVPTMIRALQRLARLAVACPPAPTMGQVVAAQMAVTGTTVKELSVASGLSVGKLERRLSDRVPFLTDELYQVAVALGTDMVALISAVKS